MLETSHSPIGPCGPLEQSPSGDRWRHALTAPLSAILDCGENAAGVEGWQREDQPPCRLRQGLCDAAIANAHLRTHHCQNSEECRQGALGTGSKDTKVKESVHVFMLVDCSAVVCVVCSCCLSACNCARKLARAWLPTCVRRHFAVFHGDSVGSTDL